jgi:hypothetical protein
MVGWYEVTLWRPEGGAVQIEGIKTRRDTIFVKIRAQYTTGFNKQIPQRTDCYPHTVQLILQSVYEYHIGHIWRGKYKAKDYIFSIQIMVLVMKELPNITSGERMGPGRGVWTKLLIVMVVIRGGSKTLPTLNE